ncbi:MAG TPA: MFS transporter [Dongiaceae bacterium]|jgi:MFS family permease|nr:MFS transporter [Dongiaceae bacterium]
MIGALRSVFSLLLGAGLMAFGVGLIGLLLPIRMGLEGVSSQIAGYVMSAYYAGFVAGSMMGQRIIGRVGHIRAFAAFAATLTAAIMVHALVFNVPLWGVMRAAVGFCMAGLYAVIESWLNVRSANELRGRVLSMYTLTIYISSGVGQLAINLDRTAGLELFSLGALLTSLSLVPVVLTRVAGPELGAIKTMSLARLYQASPLGTVATAGAGLMSGSLYALGAVYGTEIGLSVFENSIFMGAPIIGGFLLQWPIGRMSDKFDRRTVLFGVLMATVAASVLLGAFSLAQGNFLLLGTANLLLGGFLATIYPTAVAHAFDYIDRSRMVAANSGMLLAWAVGATAGPLVASSVMGPVGPSGLFVFIAIVAITLAIYTRWRMSRRAAKPTEEQSKFVPVPSTSAIAGALDPRAEPLPEFYYEDEDPGDR